MVVWQAALWGLAGGSCVEALELYAHIRQSRHKWTWRRPIPQGMAAFVVSVVIRVGVGGVFAAAMANDGQVAGAVAAFGLGVAAPLTIEKLARLVPLNLDVQAALEPPPASPVDPDQSAPTEQPATGGSAAGEGGNAP